MGCNVYCLFDIAISGVVMVRKHRNVGYIEYVLAARQFIGKRPGISRTKLHTWTRGFLHCKSDKAVRYMDKLVEDDYIREVVDVTQSKLSKRKGKRGKRETRYVNVGT